MSSSGSRSTAPVDTAKSTSPSSSAWNGWIARAIEACTCRPSVRRVARVEPLRFVTTTVSVVFPGGGRTGRPAASRSSTLGTSARRGRSSVEVAEHDGPVAVDDRADGVHDREDGDSRLADLPERAALAGRLALVRPNVLPDRRRAARAPAAEREAPGPPRAAPPGRAPCPGRRALSRASAVEDDRAGDERDLAASRCGTRAARSSSAATPPAASRP